MLLSGVLLGFAGDIEQIRFVHNETVGWQDGRPLSISIIAAPTLPHQLVESLPFLITKHLQGAGQFKTYKSC